MKKGLGYAWTVIALGLFSACGGRLEAPSAVPPNEVTPEQFAQELGVPNEPGARALKPADYARYTLVVDVFRMSPDRPVLGSFSPAYVDLLVPPDSSTLDERTERAKIAFAKLAASEFAVISVDGKPYKAEIVSGALEGIAEGGYRSTPPGAYKLDILRYPKKITDAQGTVKTADVDFPWIRSDTYGNSIMYWGLWIFGGYFIHATPHYDDLGKRASMGCVRQAYPDAMELFTLRQSHLGMILIHPIGSQQAYDRFREVTTFDWALPRLAESRSRIAAYADTVADGNNIEIAGHAWLDPSTGKPGTVVWPNCGPVDCFKIWGRQTPTEPKFDLEFL